MIVWAVRQDNKRKKISTDAIGAKWDQNKKNCIYINLKAVDDRNWVNDKSKQTKKQQQQETQEI